ncbi:DctP family TRAP transporter solute-binding subunit [Propionivibrio limicola]|uniref:DctP family TRAP transporter solute-binding subunit n=1 Tax=Propionivibrio limicola TaxID=167645 RepID=UPI0012918B88|nr:DctP family TRAP transporter solute-binding subunit [Propionivibrio limicola]
MKLNPKNPLLKLFSSLLLMAAFAVHGFEIPDRYLRLAYANNIKNPQFQGAQKLADLVAQKSKGKLGIKLYPNAAFGSDLETIYSMQVGGVDMAIMNTNLLVGLAKEAGLLDLPYLFENEQEAFKVLDGPVGRKIHAALEPVGLLGLAYFDMGYYHLHNNQRPISKFEDLRGLKIRVTETPISIDFIKALGGEPVPMAYPELYNALLKKSVDGAGQPINNIASAKFYEHQKYLSLTRHTYTPQSLLMSKKAWEKLTPEERKVISEAVVEATAFQRELSLENTARQLVFLKSKMTVNELTAGEVVRMREKVKPVTEKYAKEYGEGLARELFAEIAKVRGK